MKARSTWTPATMAAVASLALAASGIAPSGVAMADGIPAPVASVALMLKKAGYTDVAVGQRVFGGYVVQARDGDIFALFTIRPDGATLDTAELFRDRDDDGIFADDEALHLNDAQPLATAVRQALAAPASADGPATLTAEDTLSMPGFAQSHDPLFAGASLMVTATERVGSGAVTTQSEQTGAKRSVRGSAFESFNVIETTSFSGLNDRQAAASVIERGGVVGSFAPLSFGTNGADADALRAAAIAAAPEADSLRESLTFGAPDAVAVETAIRAGIPSADAIRATILPPTQ